MESFIDVIEREIEEVRTKIEIIKKRYPADDGYFLEIKKNKGKYNQFYKCKMEADDISKVQRTYLKKEDIQIAKYLAQKDFDFRLLTILKKQLLVLEQALREYPIENGTELYYALSAERKALIQSEYEDDETYIKRWRQMFLGGSQRDSFYERYPITTPYYTERGERVRSKSEKIIADKLAKEGIPYVYEPLTNFANKGMRPDFAVLNIRLRKTFFGEHFGMMDVPEYAIKCVEKINKYNELGYEYGRNLLYTFETQEAGLDTLLLDRLINSYLK